MVLFPGFASSADDNVAAADSAGGRPGDVLLGVDVGVDEEDNGIDLVCNEPPVPLPDVFGLDGKGNDTNDAAEVDETPGFLCGASGDTVGIAVTNGFAGREEGNTPKPLAVDVDGFCSSSRSLASRAAILSFVLLGMIVSEGAMEWDEIDRAYPSDL